MRAVALAVMLGQSPPPAIARPQTPAAGPALPIRDGDACRQAIRAFSAREALARARPGRDAMPPTLLDAIGRVESGRLDPVDGAVKPWPWTINAEGQGSMFPTKDGAIAAVTALRARGVVSIDVGCMQVNLAYHPAAFATLEDAFDPALNVAYAARFLGELHDQLADWDLAAAGYHSRTPDLGLPYQQKVAAAMGGGAAHRLVLQPQPDNLALAWASTMTAAPNDFASFGLVPPSRFGAARRGLPAALGSVRGVRLTAER